jgi:hypothetical protein
MMARLPVYILIVLLATAVLFQEVGRHSVRKPKGPMQAGASLLVDASYDGNPAIPGDYSWKLHVIGATKETLGNGWFTTRPGTPLAKERKIALPTRMALLQKAVDEWRFEDFDDPGLPPPLHEIRIAFQSSGMIWSSSIEAKRDADNGGRIGNDLRDFSWGCLDDLKRTDRSREEEVGAREMPSGNWIHALKGPNVIAQGNAWHRPGNAIQLSSHKPQGAQQSGAGCMFVRASKLVPALPNLWRAMASRNWQSGGAWRDQYSVLKNSRQEGNEEAETVGTKRMLGH